MIFANTDKEITLIYHSDEPIGRKILAYAKTENLPIHEVNLKYTKLTPTHWAEFASRMNIRIQELVNTENPELKNRSEQIDQFSDDDWLTVLVHNPIILKSPIVMKGEKIVMMSNAQDMLQFVK